MVKPDDKGADPKALKKELKSGQRDLDRESRRLEREEAKIITEIKAAAKKNDERTVRVLGKNLVQIRKQKDRLSTLKGNMKGMEYQGRQNKICCLYVMNVMRHRQRKPHPPNVRSYGRREAGRIGRAEWLP